MRSDVSFPLWSAGAATQSCRGVTAYGRRPVDKSQEGEDKRQGGAKGSGTRDKSSNI